MPLVRIQTTARGQKDIFIADEPIGHLATVCITSGGKRVREGTTDTQEKAAGVALAAVTTSGKIVRVVTQGIVSGVICASSIMAGERVAVANSSGYAHASGLCSGHGMITPFNTITPVGAVSRVSGALSILSGEILSGAFLSSNVSGFLQLNGQKIITPSILVSGIDAFRGEIPTFTGVAWDTGRVLGKCLTSGGMGSGVAILIGLG